MGEQIEPIVDDIFRIAYGQQGEILRARVGHVDRDRKKLFEEKESAKGSAKYLAPKREIGCQRQRNEQLQKSSSGHHDPFTAEKSEKQMAAFVDRNKDEIEPLKQVTAEESISDQQDVEAEPPIKRDARNRFPAFFKRIKKRKPFAERFWNFHEKPTLPFHRSAYHQSAHNQFSKERKLLVAPASRRQFF